MPVDMERMIEVDDPVYAFNEVLQHIDLNRYFVFEKESVDLNHIYIDGTKITANANRYSRVWKKSCETRRRKVFAKVSELPEEMNRSGPEPQGITFGTREEYAVEYLEYILKEYARIMELEPKKRYGDGGIAGARPSGCTISCRSM